MQLHLRPAERGDLPSITEIYNYYVVNTPVTFDQSPFTVEQRVPGSISSAELAGIA
jgi:phosphinothricin acetyltransferase